MLYHFLSFLGLLAFVMVGAVAMYAIQVTARDGWGGVTNTLAVLARQRRARRSQRLLMARNRGNAGRRRVYHQRVVARSRLLMPARA